MQGEPIIIVYYLLLLLNMLMPAQLNSSTHLRAQIVLYGRGGGPILLIRPVNQPL
jgi:hypothetical protein